MNRLPNYTESSQFIHQRYEDTAHVIFQQQQRKKDLPRFRLKPSSAQDSSAAAAANQELTHFGNQPGVRLKQQQQQDPHVHRDPKPTPTRSAICTIT